MYLAIVTIIVMAAAGLFLFRYMEQKRKQRVMDMHERKRAQFEELLKMISDQKDEESDTTGAENLPAGRQGIPKAGKQKI